MASAQTRYPPMPKPTCAQRVSVELCFHELALIARRWHARRGVLSAPEIVQRISDGEWMASAVLEAYIARAVLAQDATNCLTEGSSSQPGWIGEVNADALAPHKSCSLKLVRTPAHWTKSSLRRGKSADRSMGFPSASRTSVRIAYRPSRSAVA